MTTQKICRAELIAGGAKAIPKSCPIHGLTKCPEVAPDRATEAGTPAKGGTPLRWRRCRDTGHIVQDDEGDYVLHEESERHAQARAEEARREAAVKGFDAGAEWRRVNYPEGQRTAGGDAVTICEAVLESHRNARFTGTTAIGIKACIDALKAAQPVAEAAAQADDDQNVLQNWLDNAKYLLDTTPGAVRHRPGGGVENLLSSLIANYMALRDRPAAAPTAQPTLRPAADAGRNSAQPTPPDDEHPAVRELRNLLADKDVIEVITTKQEESARAALRHPPVPNVGDLPTSARERGEIFIEIMAALNIAPGSEQWTKAALAATDWAARRAAADPGAAQPTQAGARPKSPEIEGIGAEPTIHDFREDMEFAGLLDAVFEAGKELKTGSTAPFCGAMRKLNDYIRGRMREYAEAAIAAAREEGARSVAPELEMAKAQVEYKDAAIAHLRARLASAGAGEELLTAIRDGVPLVEPVSVSKAMMAQRPAEIVLAGGPGPVAAVHLVNIGVTGWVHTPETAKAYAGGFNRAAEWLRSAIVSYAGDRAARQDSAAADKGE